LICIFAFFGVTFPILPSFYSLPAYHFLCSSVHGVPWTALPLSRLSLLIFAFSFAFSLFRFWV
jgi:hypothetical protein